MSTQFQETVVNYILNGGDKRLLADSMEVTESTVTRWANGIATPMPAFQRVIMNWILERGIK